MKPNRKPNILFIMADQFRWDGIGSVGQWTRTPNLDRLAAEGITFTGCISNSPLCLPARTSLATGLYPHQTGIWHNIRGYDMPQDTATWMQAIRTAGYRTSLFGKSHHHRYQGDLRDREYLMHAYGYEDVHEIAGPRACVAVKSYMTDEWERRGVWQDYINDYEQRYAGKPYTATPSVLPLELYADVYVAQSAKEYLAAYSDSRPWFCMLSFGGPHEPWDAPEPYASMYDPDGMPQAIARPYQSDQRPRGYLDELMGKPEYSPALSKREIGELRANYAGNISLIDDQIGEVLQVLSERGELEHTVIVFTSDHGEMNGDYGLIYKSNFLKSSVQVPLIVRTPDTLKSGDAGSIYNGMVELMDVGPTLAGFAGCDELPHKQNALSLLPVIKDPDALHRPDALSEINGEVMLQTSEWKIALNREGEAYLLFDVRRDPNELNNLAVQPTAEAASTIEALKMRIAERMAACAG
ncbi:sulfatase [Paenibacillus thalictri]|uniref:Sulfatase N-terminal domain-containing protein n=1 Tax=Paenibacillus thalictri TaxID=2527873 RepID=A0A4Q9DK63_9BACL|nr:sulfatase-like hydrolase/transferase [Paenibacillus thalictri]TBL71099.1 hypothetical protein EYB31_31655 [Paenibacillus thalictri]